MTAKEALALLLGLLPFMYCSPTTEVQLIDLVVKKYEKLFNIQCSVLSLRVGNKGKQDAKLRELSQLGISHYSISINNLDEAKWISHLDAQTFCVIALIEDQLDIFQNVSQILKGVYKSSIITNKDSAELPKLSGQSWSNLIQTSKEDNQGVIKIYCPDLDVNAMTVKFSLPSDGKIVKREFNICQRQFSKKPFKVTAFEFNGISYGLAKFQLLQKKFDLQLSFFIPDFLERPDTFKMLFEEEIDFADIKYALLPDYFGTIDVLPDIEDFHEMRWLTALPKRKVSLWNIVWPFSRLVWVMILVTAILFTLFMMLIRFIYMKDQKGVDIMKKGLTNLDIVLMTFASFTQQGQKPYFTHFSVGQHCIILWTIYVLVIYFIYHCNLRASLSVPIYEKPIETNEDVGERATAAYILIYPEDVNVTDPYGYIQQANLYHPLLGGKIKHDPGDLDIYPKHIREDILNNNAVAEFESSYWNILEQMPFGKDFLSKVRFSKGLAMAPPRFVGSLLRKHSPWKEHVEVFFKELHALGLNQAYYYDSLKRPKGRDIAPSDDLKPLNLEMLSLPWMFVSGGWIFTILVFGVEKLRCYLYCTSSEM